MESFPQGETESGTMSSSNGKVVVKYFLFSYIHKYIGDCGWSGRWRVVFPNDNKRHPRVCVCKCMLSVFVSVCCLPIPNITILSMET